MEVTLDKASIDAIAHQMVKILKRDMNLGNDTPEMVTTEEAAKILRISKGHMQRIGHRFPRVKGESANSKVLYVKSALLTNY